MQPNNPKILFVHLYIENYEYLLSAWLQGRRPQRQIGKILLEGFFLPIFSDACFRGVDVRSHHLILLHFFSQCEIKDAFWFWKTFLIIWE